MRRILVVHPALVKSIPLAEGPKLSAEEKMLKILQLHVQEAKTDDERQAALRELEHFKGSSVRRAKRSSR